MLLPSAFYNPSPPSSRRTTGAAAGSGQKSPAHSVVTSLNISAVFVFYFNFFHGDLLAGIFANDRAVILEATELSQGLRHRLSADPVPVLLLG